MKTFAPRKNYLLGCNIMSKICLTFLQNVLIRKGNLPFFHVCPEIVSSSCLQKPVLTYHSLFFRNLCNVTPIVRFGKQINELPNWVSMALLCELHSNKRLLENH